MGKNSEGKWFTTAFTIERGDMRWNNYASNTDLGTRGHLTVIQNLETGGSVSRYEQTITDRILNRFDGGGPETEVGGGIMFFKTDGKGKETRFSPNADIGSNIDDLMGAFDLAKAAGTSIVKLSGAAEDIAKGVAEILDFSNNAFQAKDGVIDVIKPTKVENKDTTIKKGNQYIHYDNQDLKENGRHKG